jgi:IS30 family transposase
MANGGQPTKIDPRIHQIIIEGIKSNLPYKFCAWDAGITERTIYNWLKWGERDSDDNLITMWSEFFHAVKDAEAKKVKEHLRVIESCPERWQARMTILERRWREDFSADATQLQEIKDIFAYLKLKDLKNEKK